jgi:hypothetical protein
MSTEFNLERAIAGEPIETITGTTVEFIAYRPTLKESSQLIVQIKNDLWTYSVNGRHYTKAIDCPLDLRMKSVVKQIDWTKLPFDTLIIRSFCTGKSERYFSYFSGGMVYFYRDGADSKTVQSDAPTPTLSISPRNVQISPDQPWTVWQGGGCPLPDGLEFEYMNHSKPEQVMVGAESASAYVWCSKHIYAYRLTGKVLDGWTL